MLINRVNIWCRLLFSVLLGAFHFQAFSQDSQLSADELAKKLQDPLADLKALQVDYLYKFKEGINKDPSQSLILQPLYTIKAKSFNLITRQLIPLMKVPVVNSGITSYEYGIGDWVSSMFVSPHTSAKWKWGLGPQLSFKTRSSESLASAGWGGGVTSVIVGDYGNWATATFLSHMWGFENSYSNTTFQPLVFYNFPLISGLIVSYQGEITYQWDAQDGNKLSLPLGLQLGKMIATQKGWGIELDAGYYYRVINPDGMAQSELKATLFILWP